VSTVDPLDVGDGSAEEPQTVPKRGPASGGAPRPGGKAGQRKKPGGNTRRR